jgi:23S rRNA (cytosine1962-C5)-methyltransferase
MTSAVDEHASPVAADRLPSEMPRVMVKPRRARPLFAQHPWLFAGSIDRVVGEPRDGAQVAVCTSDDEFIAWGLYNSRSQIRVRLYSWDPARKLTDSLWRDRLASAVEWRRSVLRLDDPRGACRLVFSESDGLSGLVVDRYGPWLVVQFTSLALAQRQHEFAALLRDLAAPRGIYLRTERGIGELEGLELRDGPLWGEVSDGPVAIVEHELELEVDLRTGQKTGFYLDQRENRRVVAALARGRRVLDLFCYTGGFALAAAQAGASDVLGIDVSATAIELAQRNAARNRLQNVRFEQGNAFDHMQQLIEVGGASGGFGMVILDPPKFARNARAVDDALRGYLRANLLAVRLLELGGILVTCSCTGHVTREDFAAMLGAVAEETGRPLQILSQLGQAPDHPVSASCPETEYLKCFIVRAGAAVR